MESKNALIIIILILVISLTVFVLNRCNVTAFTSTGTGTSTSTTEKFDDDNTLTSTVYADRAISSVPNQTRPCNIYYVPEEYHINGQTLDMTIPCDMAYFNKFKKPSDLITNDLNKINAKNPGSLTEDERNIQKYGYGVLALKQDKTSQLNVTGKGYCKLDALGLNNWVELSKDEYGNIYPKKNLTNPLISAMGPPQSAAFCYKNISGGNPNGNNDQLALNMVNGVADCLDTNQTPNCAIKGMSRSLQNPSPLNDNNSYAEIAFKTLKLSNNPMNSGGARGGRGGGRGGRGGNVNEGFDNYNSTATDIQYNNPATDPGAASVLLPCHLGIPLPQGIPSYYLRFRVNASKAITSFRLMRYNQNGMIIPYPDNAPDITTKVDTNSDEAKQVNKELFTTQFFGNNLYLIPDTFNVEIYKFSYEACDVAKDIGQISYDPTYGHKTGITFSLRDNIEKSDGSPAIPAQVLYTFDSSIDSAYLGNLEQLIANQDKLNNDIRNSQPVVDAMPTPSALGLPTGSKIVDIDSSKLFAGIQYKLYTIPANSDFGDSSTNPAVIASSKKIIDTLFKTTARFKRSGTLTTLNLYDNGIASGNNIGIVFRGYIQLPESGNYNFLINSDDAGDFQITNIIRKYDNTYYDIPIDPSSTLAASYYGHHYMSMQGNNGGFLTPFNQGDILRYRARLLHGTNPDVGIQIFWLTPSKQGNTCGMAPVNPLGSTLPSLPDIYSCYVEIPDSAFFYNIGDYEKDNAEVIRQAHLNSQANLLSKAINDIQSAYDTKVAESINNILNAELSFGGLPDINDAKSDNHDIYVYIGDFEQGGSINMIAGDTSSSVDRDTPIRIQPDPMDISNSNNIKLNSPVGSLNAPDGGILPVSYTLLFGLNIEALCSDWRNILFHGVEDDGITNIGTDRTPGIWIYPASSKLHIRHHSISNPNDGIDTTNYSFPLGNYAHIAIVVSVSNMIIYINGKENQRYTLTSGNNFVWNQSVGKNLYLHWKGANNNSWTCVNGGITIKNMVWYNKELSPEEVKNEFVGTGISSTLPQPASNMGIGANTIEIGPLDSPPWSNNGNKGWLCPYDSTAKWIWNVSQSDAPKIPNKNVTFTNYYYSDNPVTATLYIAADDVAVVSVNNIQVGQVMAGWPNSDAAPTQIPVSFDQGSNDISIVAVNRGGPGGIVFTIIRNYDKAVLINSNNKWDATSSQADLDAYNNAIAAALAAQAAAAKAAKDAADAAAAKAAQDAADAAAAAAAAAAQERAIQAQADADRLAREKQAHDAQLAAAAAVPPFNPRSATIKSTLNQSKCLDIYGASQANGARAILWDCHGQGNQQWTYDPTNKSLKVGHSGKCLDVDGNGKYLQQWDCHYGGNQQWNWDDAKTQLVSAQYPDLSLMPSGGSTQNATLIYAQNKYIDPDSKKWNL